MSTSGTCSSSGRRAAAPLAALGALAGALLVVPAAAPARAAQSLSLDEALRAAFPPPATVERRTAFLSPADLEAAREAAGRDVPITQAVVSYYVARRGETPVGVAYFDSHRVRTLNEVVMVVVDPAGAIREVEVLRFAEPPEYRAGEGWLAQFKGRGLDERLSLEGAIVNLTGATLTSNAIVRASRRVLALHGRIRPFAAARAAR
jgi:electron transport complex protein RnfG